MAGPPVTINSAEVVKQAAEPIREQGPTDAAFEQIGEYLKSLPHHTDLFDIGEHRGPALTPSIRTCSTATMAGTTRSSFWPRLTDPRAQP
jgi:hypothetical protein